MGHMWGRGGGAGSGGRGRLRGGGCGASGEDVLLVLEDGAGRIWKPLHPFIVGLVLVHLGGHDAFAHAEVKGVVGHFALEFGSF